MTKSVRTTGKSEFGLDLILDGLEQMRRGTAARVRAAADQAHRAKADASERTGPTGAPRD